MTTVIFYFKMKTGDCVLNNFLNKNSKFTYSSFTKWLIILLMVVVVALIVYIFGGSRYSYTHLMYIPILIAGYALGFWQTIVIALISGLILGPFMPQDVQAEIMQPATTWVFRVVIFIVIGIINAILNKQIKSFQRLEINRLYTNSITNYPNMNRLKYDLEQLISANKPFSLLAFRIVNINSIRQNMTYDIGTKVLIKMLDLLASNKKCMVYSVNSNEILAIIPSSDYSYALGIGNDLINQTADSIQIDKYRIGILLNGSIVQYPEHIKDAHDALKKSAMILDQTTNDFGIHEFDDEMERRSKLHGELIPELLHAIKNDEFHLVYQPKICLKGEGHKSVEALLRWHHPFKGTISPLVFIPVAEEAGLMTEITRIVIRRVIEELKYLKSVGLEIKASINISPRDFNHDGFTSFIKHILTDCEIDPSLIELEVTERSVLDKSQRVIELFKEFRQMGIKISIDDFGTGYNSLIHLVNVPMDFVKLDRSFITNIIKPNYQKMIEKLISLAHDLNIKVIAEGVETKEQLNILKSMNCDIVQGYYLSKPLEREDLEAFYKNMI